ncbi:biotin transporter BioY [Paenibacillus sp. J31TS4]|uniref:biotin transporter BioY n=1 Tax=Paenibacillus sp. J31TS4 TaxID=2807195 RepID=UPI001B0EBF6D|nr:biotin transporter BioY [Paenibacillus sp. J31TS4]GIP40361.1 biotin transporter BioY [Paenibacillus sp. J31TS4]
MTFPRLSIRGVTYSALFAALFVVMSYITIPLGFSPVPLTLQNFAVMLTGALLGPFYGFLSIGAVLLLTALGLPLIHGSGGLPYLLGSTGGFIWMYPLAALLIGLVASRLRSARTGAFVLLLLAMVLFGSLLLYVTGVPWLAHVAGVSLPRAMTLGMLPYLPGDLIKAVAATAAVLAIRRANLAPTLSAKTDPVVRFE